MVYFIFTVDGDWKEYFNVNLSEEKRSPKPKVMERLIRREISAAKRLLEGKFIHFIHTSPRARNFFLKSPFIKLWKKIIEGGGDIGIHCHEDDPYRAYYGKDSGRMKKSIHAQVSVLRGLSLEVRAYRGGFLSYSNYLTSVLEKNSLYFDFSCEPGRYLVEGGITVADWRGAGDSVYRVSYSDYRKAGNSEVYEVPVGTLNGERLYFEKSDFKAIERIASGLKEKSVKEKRDIVVSVLTHSYDYAGWAGVRAVKKKIAVLKKYGCFINLKELREIIEKRAEKG